MKQWYLLYCNSQDSERVSRRVSSLGVDVFCPKYIRITPRKDCHAVRKEERVLFPSYLFLSFDINKIHTSTISSIPGAHGFVRFGAGPCIVPDEVISAIECARLIALDADLNVIECRNVNPVLLEQVQDIARMRSAEVRQIAFSKLMQEKPQ